jgi:hypothetical protein
VGTSDGTVIGTTKIAGYGPATERWNLVLLSDGYRASEMAQYAVDANSFVAHLFATPPFSDIALFGRPYSDAINVWRVDVTSTDSGADDPVACGGTGASPATYFDASFCNSGLQRLLLVNNTTAINVATAQVPKWHMVMAMVNTPIYGGGGGAVATFSLAPDANELGIHEMGHTAFGLADEYEYWAGCGVDTDRNNHPAVEPAEPNVTIDSNRATIKWGSLINPATPMPTTSNPNCANCDPQGSPVPTGTVGAFEGAHYYHCDAFRPEFHCKMRALGHDFCAVCRSVIRTTLWPFVPKPRIPEWGDDIWDRIFDFDWVSDPVPWDVFRLIEVLRRSRGPSQPALRDELSELLTRIDQMDLGQLRTMLLRVRASMARLDAASKMIEAKMGDRKG